MIVREPPELVSQSITELPLVLRLPALTIADPKPKETLALVAVNAPVAVVLPPVKLAVPLAMERPPLVVKAPPETFRIEPVFDVVDASVIVPPERFKVEEFVSCNADAVKLAEPLTLRV